MNDKQYTKVGECFANLRSLLRSLRLPAESEAICFTELNKTQLTIDVAWVRRPDDATQLVSVTEDDGQPE